MDTLGDRLRFARKSKGYTQDSLADLIGVSRGVIFNLEKNKTEPQTIVINTICQHLCINKEWLVEGAGEMQKSSDVYQSTKVLAELYEVTKTLSEDEQLYIIDVIKSFKSRIQKNQ